MIIAHLRLPWAAWVNPSVLLGIFDAAVLIGVAATATFSTARSDVVLRCSSFGNFLDGSHGVLSKVTALVDGSFWQRMV